MPQRSQLLLAEKVPCAEARAVAFGAPMCYGAAEAGITRGFIPAERLTQGFDVRKDTCRASQVESSKPPGKRAGPGGLHPAANSVPPGNCGLGLYRAT